MEALALKTANAKRAAQEDARAQADRRKWQQEHGAQGVTAKPPEGGW